MRYTVRPISDRTWLRSDAQRSRSRFTTSWSDTLRMLGREVNHLGGHNVVFEVDVEERHIRNDGMLYANARPSSPAVVVAFESKHGSLLYRSDQYARLAWGSKSTHPWQDNVRAIALTLEALRAVDRYGASRSGEQYRGYKAIGSGPAAAMGTSSHMTRDEALGIFGVWGRAMSDLPAIPAAHVNTDPCSLRHMHRSARRAAHPDRNNGDRTAWDQVEQAARVLGVNQ